ncbi:MAG: hypothetical protein GY722_17370 [bacterium]|nr:hypothetical protein [bacterium]
MDEETDMRDALRLGLRRAGMHWLRASYEVVAGVGAFLNEITDARKSPNGSDEDEPEDKGPIRIELD